VTRSEWQHQDPEGLLKRFAGTGTPGGNKQPGRCGYRETVDFGENIGIWRIEEGVTLPTTRGTIHYSNKGAHIVPSDPNPIIQNKLK
jgi:Bacterial toxin 50